MSREFADRHLGPAPVEVDTRFVAPVPVERRLSSGLRVWIHERHDLPLVSVLLVMMRGVDAEAPGKPGLASLTTRMLTEGTRTRSSTAEAPVRSAATTASRLSFAERDCGSA